MSRMLRRMSDVTPPADPFSQPPAVAPDAAAASKPTPWKAIIGVVAVVALVVVGVLLFTGGDDDSKEGGTGPDSGGEPAAVHLVGIGEAEATVYDADGSNARAVALPDDFRPLFTSPIGRWLVEDTEATTVRALDLVSGEVTSFDLPEGATMIDRGTLSSGSGTVVYFTPSGGQFALVDLTTGSVTSLGAAGDRYVLGGGRREYSFYVSTDSPSTVVVPLADPGSAWEVPGTVVDVQGTETLVLTRAADGVEVAHYAGTEQQGVPAEFAKPLITGLLTADGATMIDTGGGLWAFSFADGSRENLGVIGIGIDAGLSISTDRLLAWGSAGTVLVDAAGTVVVQAPAVKDADGEQQPLVLVSGGLGTKCITLQPGQKPRTEKAKAVIVDAANGTTVLKLDATPFAGSVSADGCSLLTSAEPSELVIDGVLVDAGVERINSVSPDYASAIAFGEDEFQLVDLSGGTSVAIPKVPYLYARF